MATTNTSPFSVLVSSPHINFQVNNSMHFHFDLPDDVSQTDLQLISQLSLLPDSILQRFEMTAQNANEGVLECCCCKISALYQTFEYRLAPKLRFNIFGRLLDLCCTLADKNKMIGGDADWFERLLINPEGEPKFFCLQLANFDSANVKENLKTLFDKLFPPANRELPERAVLAQVIGDPNPSPFSSLPVLEIPSAKMTDFVQSLVRDYVRAPAVFSAGIRRTLARRCRSVLSIWDNPEAVAKNISFKSATEFLDPKKLNVSAHYAEFQASMILIHKCLNHLIFDHEAAFEYAIESFLSVSDDPDKEPLASLVITFRQNEPDRRSDATVEKVLITAKSRRGDSTVTAPAVAVEIKSNDSFWLLDQRREALLLAKDEPEIAFLLPFYGSIHRNGKDWFVFHRFTKTFRTWLRSNPANAEEMRHFIITSMISLVLILAKKNLMIGDSASDALVYTLMMSDDSARFLARNITRPYDHRQVNRFLAEYVLLALHGHVVASSEENRFSSVKALSSAVLHDEKKMFDVEEWLDACCLEIEKRAEDSPLTAKSKVDNKSLAASSGPSSTSILSNIQNMLQELTTKNEKKAEEERAKLVAELTTMSEKKADEERAKLIAENARLKAELDACKMKIASNPPTSPHSSRTHGSSNSSSPAAASGSPSAEKAEETEVKKKSEEEVANKAQTSDPLIPSSGASNNNLQTRIYSNNRMKRCKFFFSQQGCRNGEKCQFSHQAKSGNNVS
jgi:hypothetical protein